MRTWKELRAQQKLDSANGPKGAGWFALIPLILFTVAGLVFIPQMCARQRDQQLLETGQPAVAEVLSIRETGNRYNRNPEVEIELRVQPREGEAFSLKLTKVLAQTEIAKYVEGSRIEVRYDPAKPDTVAFVGLAKPDTAPAPAPAEPQQ